MPQSNEWEEDDALNVNVVVVVTDLRASSVERIALSWFLELWNLGLVRLWPGLDVLGPSKYVDLQKYDNNNFGEPPEIEQGLGRFSKLNMIRLRRTY